MITMRPEKKRFAIALSFPGAHRPFVEEVATHLSARLGEECVLYDRYHEAEFARLDLETYLTNLYIHESELIVVFLSKEYARSEWCGLEWRAVRDLRKRGHGSTVMPLRFDMTEIEGWYSVDSALWLGDRTPEAVAELIVKRFLRLRAEADRAGNPPSGGSPGHSAIEATSTDGLAKVPGEAKGPEQARGDEVAASIAADRAARALAVPRVVRRSPTSGARVSKRPRKRIVPRNLVVCCDGFGDRLARNTTNVLNLYSMLDPGRSGQHVYYQPASTNTLVWALGNGLSRDIQAVYLFLMDYYEPGDRVFLIGFSRGAYVVRGVASLLHLWGLLQPGNHALLSYALRESTRIFASGVSLDRVIYLELIREFKATISGRECKPWFVGVWDTVSSFGIFENPLNLPYVSYNPDIQIGRHAVAIDERRGHFRPSLWRLPFEGEFFTKGPVDLKQVWFPGVHADVGGGYPERESGLSKIALEWMLEEAKAAGLLVNPDREDEVLGRTHSGRYAPPDPTAPGHESLNTLWWHFAEFIPHKYYDRSTGSISRRMNLYRRRTIPPRSLVHASAYERGEGYAGHVPRDALRVETLRSRA